MAEEKDITPQTEEQEPQTGTQEPQAEQQEEQTTPRQRKTHAVWRRLTSAVCGIACCAIIVVTAWFINRVREGAETMLESYHVTAVLRDSIDDAYGDSLTAAISGHSCVRLAEYHSARQREGVMRDSLGEDSMQLTAANPLRAYITVYPEAWALRAEKLPKVTAALQSHNEVSDVLTAPDMLRLEEKFLPLAVIGVCVLGGIIVLLCSILFIHSLVRLYKAMGGTPSADAEEKENEKE